MAAEASGAARGAARALTGVLGWPVSHSRSPAMMAAAFAALELRWRYVRLPVAPELFVETARALPASGFLGANVTIPHKEAALAAADSASDAARAIGAANTLTFPQSGGVEAENTDAGGFLDALGRHPRGMRALVLGAGGAARAVVWALSEAGAAEVLVWNRSPDRALALAAAFGASAVERHAEACRAGVDLIVNATSVGLDATVAGEDALEGLGLAHVDPPGCVVDLVYRLGATTPVSEWAKRAGAHSVDGLEVLVRQGARSLERWSGREAPLEAMRAGARGGCGASGPRV